MPRTPAVPASSKAPVSIVLDEKRFSNMAKRLAEHLGERHSIKLGHVHARTALAKALNFDSVNELQAVLKDTDAGKNSQLPILAGRFDEDLLAEAARDLLKATRETEHHGALAEELMKLLNPDIETWMDMPESADDDLFPTERFVVDSEYLGENDIPQVLILADDGSHWSGYEDRDGVPVGEDGSPIPGIRVELPRGYIVRWVLETLIATESFFNLQNGTYVRRLSQPSPNFNSLFLNNDAYEVQLDAVDEMRALKTSPVRDRVEKHPPLAAGATRLFGVAAYFVAKEGTGSLARVDANGAVSTVTANDAGQLLRTYAAVDDPSDQRIGALLPFGERSLFLDVKPAG